MPRDWHWAIPCRVNGTAPRPLPQVKARGTLGIFSFIEPSNPRHLQRDWRRKPWITIIATGPFLDDAFSLVPEPWVPEPWVPEPWGSQHLAARRRRGRRIRAPLICPS